MTTVNNEPAIRRVIFSAPRESPTIYWMRGHVPFQDFLALHGEIKDAPHPPQPEQVRHGWGSRKLDTIVMHLSDTPLDHFEPITYWIPGDHLEKVMD